MKIQLTGAPILLTLLCLLGTVAIADASLEYFPFNEELPDFVIEKLPLTRPQLFVLALRVHVLSALFSLPACLLLVAPRLLRSAPFVHRWLGRMTGGAILLFLVPSGFYLAFFARAGFWSTIGFLLSGVIVLVTTVRGIQTARSGHFAAHRMFMRHVFAQLSVAVSSRILLVLFEATSIDSDVAYLIALWVPVVGSAIAAHRPFLSTSIWKSDETDSLFMHRSRLIASARPNRNPRRSGLV